MFDMVRPLVPVNGPPMYQPVDYRSSYEKPVPVSMKCLDFCLHCCQAGTFLSISSVLLCAAFYIDLELTLILAMPSVD